MAWADFDVMADLPMLLNIIHPQSSKLVMSWLCIKAKFESIVNENPVHYDSTNFSAIFVTIYTSLCQMR